MKLPEKFYVERIYRGSEEIVGLMVVADNESTKGFQTKKDAAIRWANSGKRIEPLTIDNEPKTGFRMVTNVSRYKSKNVVWRVQHPEGFEFEITSDNMCDLLCTNTIVNGEFQDALFFTQERKLVNKNTQLYADMVEKEEKKKELKEVAKQLEPGNAFRLDDHGYPAGLEFIYMGKVHAICTNSNASLHYPAKSTLYHVVHNVNDNEYYLRSKMELDGLVRLSHRDITVDKEKLLSNLDEYFHERFDNSYKVAAHTRYLYDYKVPVAVNDKPFKRDDLVVELQEVSTNLLTIEDRYAYMFINNNDEWFRVFGFSYYSKPGYYDNGNGVRFDLSHTPQCNKIHYYPADLNENNVPVIDVDLSQHHSFGGWRAKTPFNLPSTNRNYISKEKPSLSDCPVPDTIIKGIYKVPTRSSK